MNIRVLICVIEKIQRIATSFQLDAVVQGLATMTAVPAYPVSKVGRSSLWVANIHCGHDYAILGQRTGDYQL